MSTLQGKVALVTGGSRGIGAAIARRLAEAGADVAITYVSKPDKAEALVAEVKALGRRGLAIRADSADAASIVAAVNNAAETLGGIDILVNNAGVYSTKGTLDLTLEEVDQMINVNLRAVFLASQAAAKRMSAGGRIISIGSCLSTRVPWPNTTLYALTKSGLIGLTKGLARDLGPRGITVNLVQPGPIDTDMNPADGPYADSQRALLAIQAYGSPEDIAHSVVHLAGPAGKFITAATLNVDGGFDA
jgi:3-oxoacyl-[acyl-carrier protein] reductase